MKYIKKYDDLTNENVLTYLKDKFNKKFNPKGYYFYKNKNGVTLNIINSELKEIPSSLFPLPDNLNCVLATDSSKLNKLPELPNSVDSIYCNGCQLTELPTILPDSLKYLYLNNNKLTKLPKLPESLSHLYCIGNMLEELPEIPDNVLRLKISDNNWKEPIDIQIMKRYFKKDFINTKDKKKRSKKDRFEVPYNIEYVYTDEQIDKFSSPKFQFEYIKNEEFDDYGLPKNFRNLEQFGYCEEIMNDEKYEWYFEANKYNLI